MKNFSVFLTLLSAVLLFFFIGCEPDDLENICITPEECDGTDQGSCILVAPADRCEFKAPDTGKIFYDPMLISFYYCKDNGTNFCDDICDDKITVSGEKAQWLAFPEGTSYWKLIIENEFFKEPFPVIIKVTDGEWGFGPPCNGANADNLDICMGRPLLLSPNDDPKRISCLCATQDTSTNSYPRAYLLDHRNGNLLFRGSRPCIEKDGHWQFDYDNLMTALGNLYKIQIGEHGTFPEKFRFVVISLTDNDGEGPSLRAEYEFFGGEKNQSPPDNATQPAEGYIKLPIPQNTQATVTGKFRWWYVRPDVNNEHGARTSRLDDLVDWIGGLMENGENDNPYVIYFHCSAGADRTGEVAISYLLKHRNMCPEKAFIYGTTIFDNPGKVKARQIPITNYLNGAQWYCETLHDATACTYCTMDRTSVPGSERFPCEYPWSEGECQ